MFAGAATVVVVEGSLVEYVRFVTGVLRLIPLGIEIAEDGDGWVVVWFEKDEAVTMVGVERLAGAPVAVVRVPLAREERDVIAEEVPEKV